jgi:RimJ/RimL family protein N-acetyltransferase
MAGGDAIMIPTLETERLVLRGPTRDDFSDCLAMWSDPQITRHIGGKPFGEEDVWARLMRYLGHWQLLGFGPWTVRDRGGAFVGEVGLFDFRRDITPRLDVPEVGWVLVRAMHGQGFATEAVTAALGWARTFFGHERATCIIDPDNAASRRVAEKCGFRELVPTTYRGSPTVVFTR